MAELAALEILDEALGLSAEVQCQRILYNEKVRVARDLLDERAAVARLTAEVERLNVEVDFYRALQRTDNSQVIAALTAEVEAIEAAVREVCPLSDNEGYEDEDAGAVVYRCIGEDGDPLIETESRAEVIRGLLGLWHRVSDRAELLSHDFDELSKAFAATLAQDEIAHLNRECLKLGEDNQRLTAEVERLTKEKARASQMAFEEGAVWGFTRPTGAAIQAEAVRRYPLPTPAVLGIPVVARESCPVDALVVEQDGKPVASMPLPTPAPEAPE